MRTFTSISFAFVLLFQFSCGNSSTESTTPTADSSVSTVEGSAPVAENQEPIKIGALFAVTGPASFLGEPERNAALMIAEEINAAGGINGRQVEVIVEDTEGDDTKAVVAARKLIKQDNVCAIIGPSRSGESMAVKPIADENEIVIISCAAAEGITNPLSKWVFKVPQKDGDSAQLILEHMQKKGIAKIAVLWENSSYGQSGRDQLLKLAPALGITVVADENYGPKDTDMTAQLTRFRGTDAQAVVNWSVVPGQSIVPKNMKQLGMTVPLYQSMGFANKKYVEAAGDAAEGIVLPAGAILVADQLPDTHPRKAMLMQFKQSYESKFGQEVSTFGGHAYDSLYLILEAVKNVGDDRAKIRDYIEGIKEFPGTAGIFNFSPEDHTGLTKDAFEMIIIKGGNFTLLQE